MTLAYRATPSQSFIAPIYRMPQSPVLLFLAFALIWIAPWFLFAFASLSSLSSRLFSRDTALDHDQQALLLCVLWAGFAIALFTFSSRQEYFALPALPAIALLAARWLAIDEKPPAKQHPPQRSRSAGILIAWILFVAGILKFAVLVFLAVRAPAAPPAAAYHEPDIAPRLHLHLGHQLFFGPIIDLTLAAMGAFRVPLLISAIAIAVGVTGNLIFRLRGRTRLANCFIAGMMTVCLIAAHLALNTFSPVVSSAVLAEAIKPEVDAGDVIVINGPYEDASALPFYLERQVKILNRRADVLAPWSYAPDAPPIFLDNAALASLWTSDTRVWLWTPVLTPPSLPAQAYIIARTGGREILSNQPNQGGASF
jgi:hypothetical protein